MAGLLGVVTALLGASGTTAAPAAASDEFSNALLDHWVAAMREIAARAAANPDQPAAAQIDQQSLAAICSKAGFASLAECSCTTLYANVLMIGYERGTRRFIEPQTAVERRLAERRAQHDAPVKAAADKDAHMLAGLRAAFPGGVPAAHLQLMSAYFQDRLPRDAQVWRGFLDGAKSFESTVLANQCPVPGLTRPPAR